MPPAPFSWPNGNELAISISLDDGRLSQAEVGFPILQEHGARATFYVVPSAVQKNIDAWRAVHAAGHEIANHSVTHPCSVNFTFAREKAIEAYTLERYEQEELIACNKQVHDLFGIVPQTYAYPCGQTFIGRGAGTQSVVPLVARHFVAGRVFKSESHVTPELCDLAQLPGRDFDMTPFDTIRQWIDHARQERAWLVLASHEVGAGGKPQTVGTDVLHALCQYAMDPANKVWLDTVAAVAVHVRDYQKAAAA
jgi:peptidoglycan/xylan/chitin deacetylase (PgdA/CDA1 family)